MHTDKTKYLGLVDVKLIQRTLFSLNQLISSTDRLSSLVNRLTVSPLSINYFKKINFRSDSYFLFGTVCRENAVLSKKNVSTAAIMSIRKHG